jgi:O-antigen ligase
MLATVAAVATFAADDARRSMTRVAAILFNLIALGLTASRTAIGGLVVGFTIMMAAKRRLILFACLCGALTVSAFLIPTWSGILTTYLARSQSAAQLTALNGRVAIYADAWQKIQEHWLLGEGFMSNRVAVLDEQADGSGTLHAHNILLEALTGTGIIGGFFALAACVHLCILPLVILRRSDGRPYLRREALILASSLPPVIGACLLDAGFATTLSMIGWAFMVLAARGQEAVNACTVTQKSESYRYFVLPKQSTAKEGVTS